MNRAKLFLEIKKNDCLFLLRSNYNKYKKVEFLIYKKNILFFNQTKNISFLLVKSLYLLLNPIIKFRIFLHILFILASFKLLILLQHLLKQIKRKFSRNQINNRVRHQVQVCI